MSLKWNIEDFGSVSSVFAVVLVCITSLVSASQQNVIENRNPTTVAEGKKSRNGFEKVILPFLKNHCAECHGETESKADFELHQIAIDDFDKWEKIAENLELELMPPLDQRQPAIKNRLSVVAWIRSHLKNNDREFNPEPISTFGNRIRHEDLFNGKHPGPSFSYSRIWRIRQRIYDSVSGQLKATRGVAGTTNGPVPALVGVESKAFQDYDILRLDDAAARAMMLNFKQLASTVVRGRFQKGRYNLEKKTLDPGTYDFKRSPFKHLDLLRQPSPGSETYAPAVQAAFNLLLNREPNETEVDRYQRFLADSVKLSDPATGCQNMVLAILLSPEFLFRMELGRGKVLADGRRMLGPNELAYAIALGLTDSPPDKRLLKAVNEGRLNSRQDVEREVRRMLSLTDDRKNWGYHTTGGGSFLDWKPKYNPRLLRFFQEFFGYTSGYLVFKDESRNPYHFPHNLIRDADFMILDILEKDESVLETLLTTDQFIVAHTPDVENSLRRLHEWAAERPQNYGGGALREGIQPVLVDKGYRKEAVRAYGLRYWEWDYPLKQPFRVDDRVGILTHPAWLIAWSGNFDNDIIRRGKWIREHLLADSLPELPIGVDAKLPNNPHLSLRERMQVTRAEECWRCHKQMDPLGMAFEAYDDFGRYRGGKIVLGDEAELANRRKKYGEKRNQLLKEIWKLTADSPQARTDQIQNIRQSMDKLEAPQATNPRYSKIVEEQSRRRQEWTQEIARLSEKHDDEKRKAEIASLRDRLEKMIVPAPKEFASVKAEGVLIGTRDPELDGPYKNVHELMERLARSDRVRQSFVRHVFRFFMGRNEMLTDSPTLMAMDKTYTETGGSFKEVIITLMTSDSFLTRRDKE